MDYLNQPLVVAAIVALIVILFWRLTRRGGSPEELGPGGVDRMDDHALWSRFRRQRQRDQEAHQDPQDRT